MSSPWRSRPATL